MVEAPERHGLETIGVDRSLSPVGLPREGPGDASADGDLPEEWLPGMFLASFSKFSLHSRAMTSARALLSIPRFSERGVSVPDRASRGVPDSTGARDDP